MTSNGDDVYYTFGGAVLCEMLHLGYQQIKTSPLSRKDSISLEITILQAINSKDTPIICRWLQVRGCPSPVMDLFFFLLLFKHTLLK